MIENPKQRILINGGLHDTSMHKIKQYCHFTVVSAILHVYKALCRSRKPSISESRTF